MKKDFKVNIPPEKFLLFSASGRQTGQVLPRRAVFGKEMERVRYWNVPHNFAGNSTDLGEDCQRASPLPCTGKCILQAVCRLAGHTHGAVRERRLFFHGRKKSPRSQKDTGALVRLHSCRRARRPSFADSEQLLPAVRSGPRTAAGPGSVPEPGVWLSRASWPGPAAAAGQGLGPVRPAPAWRQRL